MRRTDRKQLNRKKLAWGIFFIVLLIFYCMRNEPERVMYKLTAQIYPGLTYSAEYGDGSSGYEASYDVPEWFYEDEDDGPVNPDLAALDNEALDDNTNDIKEEVQEASTIQNNKSVGTVYTREQLSSPDFLTSRIFVVDNNTSMSDEELSVANLLDTDVLLNDLPEKGTGENAQPYKVLIYHTHGSESFADSRPGEAADTVIGIGQYLADILNEQYNIPTYHDGTLYDVIDGTLDRSKAYENAYAGISEILEKNPSIEVVIDLHRDGVNEDTHLVTEVNGKPTAKIMFLNGVSRSNMNGEIEYLKNPNKMMNLAFSFQLYLAGKEDYGDYVRKIYVRSLRYNLHAMPRATLIEAGAQNNTIEEEKNAMEPLAAMLDKVLRNSE